MPSVLVEIARRLGRLRRDRRGNVLMLFALSLIPLTFATGMGIDYSAAMRLKTKLDAAADAAALAATTTPMLNQTMMQACTAATGMFVLQSGNLAGLTLNTAQQSGLSITMTETYSGAGNTAVTATCGSIPAAVVGAALTPVSRVATVTYRGTSANSFALILRIPTLTVKGTSTARVGLGTYYQIVFAIDVSNSMGIGGTTNDISSLQSDPQISCAFACHDPNSTGSTPTTASRWCESNPSDYFCHHINGQLADNKLYCPFGTGNCGPNVYPSVTYADKRNLAKTFGYKLKIDYVNDAVTSFIDALQTPMTRSPNNFSVSLYTFGTGATSGTYKIPGTGLVMPALQAATTNWVTLKANSGQINLEVADYSPTWLGNQGWTYTSNALENLRSSLSNVGDGSSPTARKTYVIFISDGVEDIFDPSNLLGQYSRATTYNYAQRCQAIKDAGITMFSIETAYPNVPNDSQYNALVRDLPSRNSGTQIADVMKGCASSPSRYFLASDGPGIQSAVQGVFASINAEASRLTQ